MVRFPLGLGATSFCIHLERTFSVRPAEFYELDTPRNPQDGSLVQDTANTTDEDARKSGCRDAQTCQICLQSTPACKWCPSSAWVGDAKQLVGNEKQGVCSAVAAAKTACGGVGWFQYRKTPFTVKPEAKRATDDNEADLFCPFVQSKNAGPGVQKMSRMTASTLLRSKINDTESLLENLISLNADLNRLNLFRSTNPALFDAKFGVSGSSAATAAKWTWKLASWGSTFIPVWGSIVSFSLGTLTDLAESMQAALVHQGRSQDLLISKGRDATLQYFHDVMFGDVFRLYTQVFSLSHEEVAAKQHDIGDSVFAGKTGVAAAKYSEVRKTKTAKVLTLAGHTGLFVGGFFTFGATWIANTAWGISDLAAAASTEAAIREATKLKTTLLLSLARQYDDEVWNSTDATKCDTTDWFRGVDPCPAVAVGSGADRVLKPQVCSRSSPWGSHHGHVKKGLLAPQGVCTTAPSSQFQDGLPCLSHESCQSGFCHFEPRIQYFFSSHKRAFCSRTHTKMAKDAGKQPCLSAADQLLSLQVLSLQLPNEGDIISYHESVRPAHEFVGSYDSYDGARYATTGTCAKTCPRELVGQGSCAALTLLDTPIDGNDPELSSISYDFGVVLPNRIFVGFGQQGYRKIGQGICLQRDEPLFPSSDVVWLHGNDEQAIQECAAQAWKKEMASFHVIQGDGEEKKCHLFRQVADGVGVADTAQCFQQLPRWPLDIHQPWNFEWHAYMSNLGAIVEYLEQAEESRRTDKPLDEPAQHVLDKVRQAYAGICVLGDPCPKPELWSESEAIHMLQYVAPLGAKQLSVLRAEIDPEFKRGGEYKQEQKVRISDLMKRRAGFGEAWKRFLIKVIQQEVDAEDRALVEGEIVHHATLSRDFVESLQTIATDQNLVYPDGIWNLLEAQNILLQTFASQGVRV